MFEQKAPGYSALQTLARFSCVFARHPTTVVAPDRVPPLIYSLPQKLRAIEALGVDTTLLIHFDKPFSQKSGEAFIRGLARDLSHSAPNALPRQSQTKAGPAPQ